MDGIGKGILDTFFCSVQNALPIFCVLLDIRRHYRERIKKDLHGVLFESNLIIELLAYINVIFRYPGAVTAKAPAVNSPEKNNKRVYDYSKEEISAAASYLIYLFTDEKGFQPKREKWLDIDYILLGKIDKLILLACHRNLILEWEFLVAGRSTPASCWAGEQFADEDLARYLSDADPLSKSFLESMKPYTETFCCQGKTMQLNSYTYNSLLHLEKQDKHLRMLDKNEEEWQRLGEQFRIKRE